MSKESWKRVFGPCTPGGDPVWICPVCGKGRHVYGIEFAQNYRIQCPDCGTKLKYPWENFYEKYF